MPLEQAYAMDRSLLSWNISKFTAEWAGMYGQGRIPIHFEAYSSGRDKFYSNFSFLFLNNCERKIEFILYSRVKINIIIK